MAELPEDCERSPTPPKPRYLPVSATRCTMVYSPEAPQQSSLTYCREEFSSEVLKYLIASEDLPFNFVKNPDMQHFS